MIDMVTTIVSYRFGQIDKKEVEEMLGITLKGTRVYQDIKEEVLEEALEE